MFEINFVLLHELVRLCCVVYAEPLAVRGQVGCCTLQLCNSTVEVELLEGRFPPSVNNAVARLLRQVETRAWKAAPQLEPRVSFQLLGGKSPVVVGAHVGEYIQLFWIVRNIKEYGIDLSTMPKFGEKGNLVSLKVAWLEDARVGCPSAGQPPRRSLPASQWSSANRGWRGTPRPPSVIAPSRATPVPRSTSARTTWRTMCSWNTQTQIR